MQQHTQNRDEESRKSIAGQVTYSKVNQPSTTFDSKTEIVSIQSEPAHGVRQNTTLNKRQTKATKSHPNTTRQNPKDRTINEERTHDAVIKPAKAGAVKTERDDNLLQPEKDNQPKVKNNSSYVSLLFAVFFVGAV